LDRWKPAQAARFDRGAIWYRQREGRFSPLQGKPTIKTKRTLPDPNGQLVDPDPIPLLQRNEGNRLNEPIFNGRFLMKDNDLGCSFANVGRGRIGIREWLRVEYIRVYG
jgi:hypothetical protein